MSYFTFVRIFTNALFILLGAVLAHFALFAVWGIFFRKTYPKTDVRRRYGIIIPARNE